MWVKDEAAQRCKASLTHGFLRNTLNHAQEMLSVIIPQIKQAISLATAVFAMFTFDRIAILKYFFLAVRLPYPHRQQSMNRTLPVVP